MGPEAKLWKHLRPRLTRACTANALPCYIARVENSVNPGHPDVEYIIDGRHGTIELKVIPEWPKREKTTVRIPHYTKQQKDDAKERYLAGGWAFLLLQVGGEYLLFSAPFSCMVGTKTRAVLYGIASRRWIGTINGEELLELIR